MTSTSGPLVELRDVRKSFDQKEVLRGVSLDLREGTTVAVMGGSGAGKTVLLRIAAGLVRPDAGQVSLFGTRIERMREEAMLAVRKRSGFVFQGAALFDSLSVFENVAYPLREHTNMSEDEIEERVREKLEFVDLDADRVMEQMPSELSGGMRKRVGIARGMANNPEIMLYDEPTSGLDPLTTGTITRLIRKLQKELGVTSIVVSHDMRSVSRMASKIALLHDRHIVFFGEPEEMFASEDPYIREFLGG